MHLFFLSQSKVGRNLFCVYIQAPQRKQMSRGLSRKDVEPNDSDDKTSQVKVLDPGCVTKCDLLTSKWLYDCVFDRLC